MKPEYIRTIVQLALAEDIGQGDITTDYLVPAKCKGRACLVAKADGVLCGLVLAREVFKSLDPQMTFRALRKDGERLRQGDTIAELRGSTRALLSGERVVLNFLSMLSGIATRTRAYVQAVKPFKVAVLDTRKTTPLLRQLDRYAVRCGGGVNHRYNLNDMVMVKDNHLACSKGQSIVGIVDGFKKRPKVKVEIEVDDLEQLKQALMSKADIILLDNMTPRQIAQAVAMRNRCKSRVLLESSGGITLKNIKDYARAGVDRISVGALTHSRQALDISLEFEL